MQKKYKCIEWVQLGWEFECEGEDPYTEARKHRPVAPEVVTSSWGFILNEIQPPPEASPSNDQ